MFIYTFIAYVCLSCVQCLNYIQLVWQEIIDENKQDSNTELYNGAVESLYTLIGRYLSSVILMFNDNVNDVFFVLRLHKVQIYHPYIPGWKIFLWNMFLAYPAWSMKAFWFMLQLFQYCYSWYVRPENCFYVWYLYFSFQSQSPVSSFKCTTSLWASPGIIN